MHIARPLISQNQRTASVESLSVLYVLGEFPVLSETFVSNEIRAMRRLGHHIVPLALRPAQGLCQPEDEMFRDETMALADVSTRCSAHSAGPGNFNMRCNLQWRSAASAPAP